MEEHNSEANESASSMDDSIDYSRQYAKWHSSDPSHHLTQSKTYRKYLDFAKIPENGSILDIGCGMGFFLRAAANYGFQTVKGIDTSPHQVAVARSFGYDAEQISDTETWLAQHVGDFDAIFMFDVLEHIPVQSQIHFLRSVREALRAGGRIFVRVPNASSFFGTRYRYIDWTHHCTFTEHSLDFVLFNAGFKDISVLEDHFSRTPLWFPSPTIGGLLRTIHFGAMRMRCIAEFGRFEGCKIPLTLNIFAEAVR